MQNKIAIPYFMQTDHSGSFVFWRMLFSLYRDFLKAGSPTLNKNCYSGIFWPNLRYTVERRPKENYN
ncbi:hypothetical protein A7X67_04215 [Clostridium sp. W14A]|nr:hypothetical protein A7X67_04215 [Clostridium sp. W14A]